MDSPIAAHRATLRAFAVTIVPEAAALNDAGWSEVESTIALALSQRPARMQRQLKLLLRLLERLPLLRYGRPFTRLGSARRARVVDALQHAPLTLLRRGVWGLRTLVLMGYYTRTAAAADIGYRADARGWQRSERVPRP